MLTNMIYALFPALVAYGSGVDPWYAALIWWVAYRVEFIYDAVAAVARGQAIRVEIEKRMALNAIERD